MSLRYQKRVTLFQGSRPGVPAKDQTALVLNLRLGLPTLSLRWRGVTWNTARGFSSVRLGRGFTWMDRDR